MISTVALRVQLVCPAPPGSRQGNRVSALRWAGILRSLGHRARITLGYDGEDVDVLVALHATRSAPAIRAFRGHHGKGGLILALTGTDLYRDLHRASTRQSLELADRLLVLQPEALKRLDRRSRRKARVVYQSVVPGSRSGAKDRDPFDVYVIGHLRAVKDPFRTALAVRRLPESSRVRVWHLGRALGPGMAARARQESQGNRRYHWLGERSRPATLRRLARSQLLVLSSRTEGGANVIGEAAVAHVPILASRIDGSIGLLGRDHPGFFPVGDTNALRELILRAESDRAWYRRLRQSSVQAARLFRPAAERRAWRRLLGEVAGS